MDVLTPKGLESLEQEVRAAQLFEQQHPGYQYVATPKDKPAIVDAVITKGPRLFAAVETKCRNMTLETFQKQFNSEWLVTFDKVMGARDWAMKAGIPLYGFLFLVPSDVLLVQRLFDDKGLIVGSMKVEASETQRTINGGTAVRTNAYIKVTT